MKIVAYCPLLYGKEYLKEAIESVAPFADRIIILHATEPSFGFPTNRQLPDSEEELRACCDGVKDKLLWHKGRWYSEGQHRDTVFHLCPDADLVLPIDADEIWETRALQSCIAMAAAGTARNYLIGGWKHYWRSLHWACTDVWQPVRIIKPAGHGDASLPGAIHHLGYAQASATVAFKMAIHGHKNEIRPGWFDEIFMNANRTKDLHPVVKDWWNAEKVTIDSLPAPLKAHPNFIKTVIA